MKYTGLLALLLICAAYKVRGQNLVPNPSFEIKTSCPNDQDQLYKAPPWYRPTANTPDYFNACSIVPQFNFSVGVPLNNMGYQYAHTGNGYAGFGSYYYCSNNCREYIAIPLIDTLRRGVKYCVTFYVSLADSSYDGISPIGAYFSNSMINDQSTLESLPYTPQISSSLQTPLSDTMKWELISGSFVANGGEKYMTIGTFVPDTLLTIDTTIRPRPFSYARLAYYYIDDVSVIAIASCNAGNDVQICLTDSTQLGVPPDSNIVYLWVPSDGLSSDNISNPMASPFLTTTYTLTQTQCDVISTATVTVTVDHSCSPGAGILIPTLYLGNQLVFISGLESKSQVDVFDLRGRLVFSADDYQNDLWTGSLAAGIYTMRLIRPNSEIVVQKFCVVE